MSDDEGDGIYSRESETLNYAAKFNFYFRICVMLQIEVFKLDELNAKKPEKFKFGPKS